jgi:hypothetical protein
MSCSHWLCTCEHRHDSDSHTEDTDWRTPRLRAVRDRICVVPCVQSMQSVAQCVSCSHRHSGRHNKHDTDFHTDDTDCHSPPLRAIRDRICVVPSVQSVAKSVSCSHRLCACEHRHDSDSHTDDTDCHSPPLRAIRDRICVVACVPSVHPATTASRHPCSPWPNPCRGMRPIRAIRCLGVRPSVQSVTKSVSCPHHPARQHRHDSDSRTDDVDSQTSGHPAAHCRIRVAQSTAARPSCDRNSKVMYNLLLAGG